MLNAAPRVVNSHHCRGGGSVPGRPGSTDRAPGRGTFREGCGRQRVRPVSEGGALRHRCPAGKRYGRCPKTGRGRKRERIVAGKTVSTAPHPPAAIMHAKHGRHGAGDAARGRGDGAGYGTAAGPPPPAGRYPGRRQSGGHCRVRLSAQQQDSRPVRRPAVGGRRGRGRLAVVRTGFAGPGRLGGVNRGRGVAVWAGAGRCRRQDGPGPALRGEGPVSPPQRAAHTK